MKYDKWQCKKIVSVPCKVCCEVTVCDPGGRRCHFKNLVNLSHWRQNFKHSQLWHFWPLGAILTAYGAPMVTPDQCNASNAPPRICPDLFCPCSILFHQFGATRPAYGPDWPFLPFWTLLDHIMGQNGLNNIEVLWSKSILTRKKQKKT